MILLISILCFLVMSLSFLIMPLVGSSASNDREFKDWLPGLLFWSFLLTGVILQIVLANHRRQYLLRLRRSRGREWQGGLPGIISFCKNGLGVIVDVAMLLGMIGFIISIISTHAVGYSCYVFLTILVFSFCLHCIFNGKNYQYIRRLTRRFDTQEPKAEIETEIGVCAKDE